MPRTVFIHVQCESESVASVPKGIPKFIS